MESRGMIHEMREMQVMNMGQYARQPAYSAHGISLQLFERAWKAQYWIREIMNKLYTAGPDGYCGDEDNGQTSPALCILRILVSIRFARERMNIS